MRIGKDRIECLMKGCEGGLYFADDLESFLTCTNCGGKYGGAKVNDTSEFEWAKMLAGHQDYVVMMDRGSNVHYSTASAVEVAKEKAANQKRIDAATEKAAAEKVKAQEARWATANARKNPKPKKAPAKKAAAKKPAAK